MSFLLRVEASYFVLVGAAVAVHFIITPLHHPGGYAPFTAWHVMNWFMAPAMLITLGASYWAKRRTDTCIAADLRGYLEANTVFYGAVGASIVYFWNWFSSLSPDNVADHRFWVVLGAAMPILLVIAGIRLWKYAAGAQRREEAALPIRSSAKAV